MPAAIRPVTHYPSLVESLPPLVRKQRRLEATLAAVAQTALDEKAVRAEIDLLLVAAGVDKGESVTCLGYDVTHVERAGTSRLNQDVLIVHLVAAGLAERLVRELLQASTDVGEPTAWATVKPSKGAKVRTP
jgi:hypothetical protein